MKTLSIVFVAIFLIFSNCKMDTIKTDNTKINGSKDNYEIALNESFQLDLISNPTTGYSWKWINKQSVSIVDTCGYDFISDNPSLMGSGGKEIWKFKGKKVGADTIKLEYNRSWEPNSTTETRKIFIKVR